MDREEVEAIMGEVLGDDVDGMDVVGRRHVRGARGRMIRLPPKPAWRNEVIVPGVMAPSTGLEPLPLVPDAGGGTFSALVTNITFRARPQRPFRSERLLAQVFRNGASASALAAVTNGIFVGTNLQQLQIGSFNLEFFAPTAFGVRLDMQPAEAGIDISINVILTGALAGADTIGVQLLLLGSSIR